MTAASPRGKNPQIARYAIVPNGTARNSETMIINSMNAMMSSTNATMIRMIEPISVTIPCSRPCNFSPTMRLTPISATV